MELLWSGFDKSLSVCAEMLTLCCGVLCCLQSCKRGDQFLQG
jgi:hypothetical protein